jgi:ribonuclease HI
MEKVLFLSTAVVASHNSKSPKIAKRRSGYCLQKNRITGWFDGASQRNGEISGVGGLISLNEQNSYRWSLNCGRGTNTRAELLGAWAILTLAHRLAISDILILGDSKLLLIG